MSEPRGAPRIAHETRLALLALASGAPAVVAVLYWLWTGEFDGRARWTGIGAVLLCWLACASLVRERARRPLQTLSNLLAALHEGDYSIRARGGKPGDSLDLVHREINALSATLQTQRMGALEATALLRSVMTEIDVAVFTFDDARRLRLVNRAGETLLRDESRRMLGKTADELQLADCLDTSAHRTVERTFPSGAGRWSIRVSSFREDGRPHQLLVVEDLTRALREEELQAWKRLVRVLGHELNNSLAPIKSIAGSLSRLVARDPLPEDWREDTRGGLGVIESRSESLSRFLDAYARMAKLPPPTMGDVAVAPWIRRVAVLETRVTARVDAGPEMTIRGDAGQLEQLLINLVRNAADASLATGGGVRITWTREGPWVDVLVEDEGHGLANTANLFVPFFTTKPEGSGIGLVLCRQIAEGHGGSVALANRASGRGCEARLRLPA